MNTNNPTCHCGKTMEFDGLNYVCACKPEKPPYRLELSNLQVEVPAEPLTDVAVPNIADPSKQAQNAYAYVVDKPLPDFDSII